MGRPLSTPVSLELGFSFDTTLASNLLYWRNAVLNQDIDCGIIVDGKEGSGKSVFGLQIAKFMDRDRHIDLSKQVCYYPEQFKNAVMTLPKGKAIVWDEARRGLNRRRSVQDINLSMTDMLAECRQHNLFLVIIMPSFYDMDMYAAVWRSRVLIHVYYHMDPRTPEEPIKRGYFRLYTEEGKKRLYCNPDLRKMYAYPYLKGECFDGRFSGTYVVDEAEYRKLKRDAEAVYRKGGAAEQKGSEHVRHQTIGEMYRFLSVNRWLKQGALKALCGYYQVSDETLYNWTSLSGGAKSKVQTEPPIDKGFFPEEVNE